MILMDFSYFFLIFSDFLAGFGVLFCRFQRFQLLFSDLFQLFGRVWGAVWGISAVSATFFLIFFGFLAGFNVYPMSRTFSFLFSKYLDTKFYGIPGFIQ